MKKVLIDSSSAILLFKSGLFDHLVNIFEVWISNSVYKELTIKVNAGSTEFKKYIQNHKMTICQSKAGNDASLLSKLDTGERDTILLFQKGNADFIIIDDGQGAGYCRRHEIPYINALLFPKILLFSGHISQAECRDKIELIMGLGRYSQEIIEYALGCDKIKLELFLP
jgi:predicted nucleic acid-binding protein